MAALGPLGSSGGGGSTPGGSGGGAGAGQLAAGNPLYETYYKQASVPHFPTTVPPSNLAAALPQSVVDPAGTGRVGASDAALFLKKSGLADAILGKGFFLALRLVASAQSGHDVGFSSLGLTLPPPKFQDNTSPMLISSSDAHWAVRVEERAKFDGIFESLLPVNGLLSGDKVKPVLINSKLPLDVLGRVWDLSDIDKDGHLDRDEFAVAMHLVYRALEKEPVPSVLPLSLVPPSKRKKSPVIFPGAVPVLPASPPPKDSLRSTPSHGSVNSLNSTGSLSPKHSLKQGQAQVLFQPPTNWVVPLTDKIRYDEIFLKTDLDLDGFVSGLEVKDIFMHSGLSQNVLAHIWALADTRQMGKLNKDQFALAMHLIQQKVSKGIDPPQVLLPDMIPPAERTTPVQTLSGYLASVGTEISALAEMRRDSSSSVGSGEFTGVKELDDISQEIAQLQREKYSLEQEIREREGAIRQKTSEVQISSLKMQIQSQESDLKSQEDDISRAKAELNRLQQEETQLGQSIQAGKIQLETIIKSLKSTQEEINQARSRLSRLQESHLEASRHIDQYNEAPNGVHQGGSMTNLADLSEGNLQKDRGGFGILDDPFKNKALLFSGPSVQELPPDPFHAEDPFKGSDPFQNDPFAEQPPAASDPFGGDPFEESDPFRASAPEDFFKKAEKTDPFTSDPFLQNPTLPSKPNFFDNDDPFLSLSVSSSKVPDALVFRIIGGILCFGAGEGEVSWDSPDQEGSGSPGRLRGRQDPGAAQCCRQACLAQTLTDRSLPCDSWLLDPFGTLDAFGSSTFSSGGGSSGSEGFADFSRMSKPLSSDPFLSSSFGGTGFPDDPFKSQADTPALPPKKNMPPRPKPPSGKSPPPGEQQRQRGCQPVGRQPRERLATGHEKQREAEEGGRGKPPQLGNEEQQLAWAKRESEKAERDRLARLRRQEQEDLELAIALSKADMPAS
ncbi:hypothetical protein JD844_033910 [Phrynosoma platyrhinos]|uniref:Epidermal growth factor receptor pathway substrate 15-like 1 n=1 Tax=Phrynosoma platyrhinos TaxID=52577 RepID=A0ABQ7T7Q1_PHRPL|nr:hypothetical protein JD844_033910 [Phrynosoma platyrhinos]